MLYAVGLGMFFGLCFVAAVVVLLFQKTFLALYSILSNKE